MFLEASSQCSFLSLCHLVTWLVHRWAPVRRPHPERHWGGQRNFLVLRTGEHILWGWGSVPLLEHSLCSLLELVAPPPTAGTENTRASPWPWLSHQVQTWDGSQIMRRRQAEFTPVNARDGESITLHFQKQNQQRF